MAKSKDTSAKVFDDFLLSLEADNSSVERQDFKEWFDEQHNDDPDERAGLINEITGELGVSRRTVERWVTDSSQQRAPSKEYQAMLADFADARGGRREVTKFKRSGRIVFSGTVHISKDKSYRKDRVVDFTSDELAELFELAGSGEYEFTNKLCDLWGVTGDDVYITGGVFSIEYDD